MNNSTRSIMSLRPNVLLKTEKKLVGGINTKNTAVGLICFLLMLFVHFMEQLLRLWWVKVRHWWTRIVKLYNQHHRSQTAEQCCNHTSPQSTEPFFRRIQQKCTEVTVPLTVFTRAPGFIPAGSIMRIIQRWASWQWLSWLWFRCWLQMLLQCWGQQLHADHYSSYLLKTEDDLKNTRQDEKRGCD